jgi:protein tyrosine phosphatase (PTP) superfamily phosphohydrolase (DUF442 family)
MEAVLTAFEHRVKVFTRARQSFRRAEVLAAARTLENKGCKMRRPILAAAFAALMVSGADAQTNRPSSWAQPVALEGVPNLFQVSPDLYRSAQPTEEGMKRLKGLGIKTVVNLRSFHSDRDEIGQSGLSYEHLYMKAWHPEQKEAVKFLQIVTDPERTPVLVHCQHGADRTGTMCAVYRLGVQKWSKEEAVAEMTQGGFGFHAVWVNLPAWIEQVDAEALKRVAEKQTAR